MYIGLVGRICPDLPQDPFERRTKRVAFSTHYSTASRDEMTAHTC